ncbi:hypothetical protein [Cellulomonas soli]|uniref:hypothetical protein n=1 Tax=Cellulomonas soli TaxID=931535 RepID=UPI0011BEB12B|nr:hypothetical protein [Cellulomonas soli]NYI59026.1 hypothetical protein [Cellulomonas soli]
MVEHAGVEVDSDELRYAGNRLLEVSDTVLRAGTTDLCVRTDRWGSAAARAWRAEDGCMSVTSEYDGALVGDLLSWAADDWTDAAGVVSVALGSGSRDPQVLRDLSLGLLVHVVANGLAVIGEIGSGRHVPWPGTSAETLLRAVRDWVQFPTPRVSGSGLFWLDATPEGEAIGRSLWGRTQLSDEEDLAETSGPPLPARWSTAPTLRDEVIRRGAEGPLPAHVLVHVASGGGVSAEEGVQVLALGLLAHLVALGSLVLGDRRDGRFAPWEGTPAEAMLRVGRSWLVPDGVPSTRETTWFQVTPRC